ncbi:hypothetical protein MBEHAL_0386 [Halarchaeum acidiphilum MH1-52-1]|uniref:Uncharacterized protein n=1 Tax=Halarchaeum acidiphilum MH1-52-1 TaxID=1261545 RepID=U2YD88_9EURY|nr:hypothetical protein [Halarchaeum acidiphilum]GAD51626.1 hypothetical protein MBEHAL_0386 [Halarchaeum acidiphilum MH1-52-1]
MDVRIEGVDDLEAALERGLERIGELRAGTRVDSDAFFSKPFMREHTEYGTFGAFRADAPLDFDVPLDESTTRRRRADRFVSDVSDFETWEEMKTRAAHEEILDQLLSNTS